MAGGTAGRGKADANGNVIQTVDLPDTTSAHSIAVDPLNGDVFVARIAIQQEQDAAEADEDDAHTSVH